MLTILPQTGREDMGDVDNKDSRCRFFLDADVWQLVFIRLRYATLEGAGDKADLLIKIDHQDSGGLHNYLLSTLADMGTGTGGNSNANIRIMPDEEEHWQFQRGDHLVLEWTNPDTGKIRWIVEVGLKVVDNG